MYGDRMRTEGKWEEGQGGRVDESGVAEHVRVRPSSLVTHTTMSRKSKTRAQTYGVSRSDMLTELILSSVWLERQIPDQSATLTFPTPCASVLFLILPISVKKEEEGPEGGKRGREGGVWLVPK